MSLHDEVISAIAEYHSIPRRKITVHSSLMNDLGIVGDDAEDLIRMLEDRFSVDLSDVQLSRYFHGESPFAFDSKEELIVGQLVELIASKQAK